MGESQADGELTDIEQVLMQAGPTVVRAFAALDEAYGYKEVWDCFRLYPAADLAPLRDAASKRADRALRRLADAETWQLRIEQRIDEGKAGPNASQIAEQLKRELAKGEPRMQRHAVEARALGALLDYRLDRRLKPDEVPPPFAELSQRDRDTVEGRGEGFRPPTRVRMEDAVGLLRGDRALQDGSKGDLAAALQRAGHDMDYPLHRLDKLAGYSSGGNAERLRLYSAWLRDNP